MALEVRLTTEQFPFYKQACEKAKIEFKSRGTLIELDRGNFEVILAAMKTAHAKALALKTKSIVTMEKLWNLEKIIGILENQASYFPKLEEVVSEVSDEPRIIANDDTKEAA